MSKATIRQHQEAISAFMDAETTSEESETVIRSLQNDPALRSTWRDYHTISAVMRKERLSSLDTPPNWKELAARASEASNVLPIKRQPKSKWLIIGGVGSALAACLMLSVFLVQTIFQDPHTEAVSQYAGGSGWDDPIVPVDELLSYNHDGTVLSLSSISVCEECDFQAELDKKLRLIHAHNAAVSAMYGSPITYAKVVTSNVVKPGQDIE